MKGAVLILGATSAIAKGTAAALARRGHPLFLAARDTEEAERIAANIHVRYGVEAATGPFDAGDPGSHGKVLRDADARMGGLEGILIAFGFLGDQAIAARDVEFAQRIIRIDFSDAVSVLIHAAGYLEGRRRGFIVGLSSVAGDRGRRRNYPYGAAKGALSLYLQGLRSRLHPAGVRVMTVKLGFVDTPMTFGLPGMFLVDSPGRAGEAIARALDRGCDVVYVPWFWRYVLWAVRLVPERWYKRLDF